MASGGRGGLWGRREVGKEAPPPPPPPLGARHGVTLGTGGFVGCHDGLGGGPAGDGAVYEADGRGSSGDVPDGLTPLVLGRWSLCPADGTLAYTGAARATV